MTQLNRIRVALTGFPGAPGVATFYSLNTNTVTESLHTLWTSLAGYMPSNVTITVASSGDIIDSTNGNLVGTWNHAPTAPIQGTKLGVYAAPVGLMIRWDTDVIADSHRVRGRTFVVPIAAEKFAVDGSLDNPVAGEITGAAEAYIFEQSLDFVIWHRPYAGRAATATLPAKAAHLGSHALVKRGTCPDKVVVLRSRRD